jgi:hypothetical protein
VLWLVAGGAGFVALLLLAAAVLPMPSTLMLWRHASGQPVTRVWVPLERISPHLVHAVVGTEVGEITDAPFLVEAQPDGVLIPALDAFGAEQGGEERE